MQLISNPTVRYLVLFLTGNCFVFTWLFTFSDVPYAIKGYFKLSPQYLHIQSTVHVNPTCKFPTISPWDTALLPFLEHPTEVTCSRVQPDLTFVDTNGYLQINETELSILKSDKELGYQSCHYTYFDRGKTDRMLTFESPLEINLNSTQPIRMKHTFVQVNCFVRNSKSDKSKLIYRNVHSHIPHASSDIGYITEDQLSVLMFTLESTSANMVRRYLPLTLKFLTDTMGATMFTSFNKVGENTLPNLVPMFTGLRARNEESNTMKAELKKDAHGYYDHFPMIWKKFKANNYSTSYIEDYSHIGTFHYSGNGFKRKPVDYWYFPFWEALRQAELPKKSSQFCFGNKPIVQIFMDILRNHIISLHQVPSFIFSIFSDLSHDYANDIQRADNEIYELLKFAFQSGYLNRTLLLFLGDHGQRFTSIRPTVAGYIEERNPALFIYLPKWFREKYSTIQTNINLNVDRLVSPFDIHETFLDILHMNFTGQQRPESNRGQSLLYPINLKRTCREANIPSYYCLCGGLTILSESDDFVQRAAQSLIEAINNLDVIRQQHLCAAYSLQRVIYAIKTPNYVKSLNITISNLDSITPILIAVDVLPKAKFEGLVLFVDKEMSKMIVDNYRLERIDRYYGRSNCVSTFHDKKFCTCKNALTKTELTTFNQKAE